MLKLVYLCSLLCLMLESEGKGDNSNYCCEVEMPVINQQRSRTKIVYKQVKTNITVGYKTCGMFFRNKCPITEEVYAQEPAYRAEYYTVRQQLACPSDKVACCPGFVMKDQHCMSIEELLKKGMTMDDLAKSGLGPFKDTVNRTDVLHKITTEVPEKPVITFVPTTTETPVTENSAEVKETTEGSKSLIKGFGKGILKILGMGEEEVDNLTESPATEESEDQESGNMNCYFGYCVFGGRPNLDKTDAGR